MRGRARRDGRAGARARGAARGRPPRCAAAGRKVKFVYTIPSFHNTGRRHPVPRAAPGPPRRWRGDRPAVIEDNPYGLLGFDAEPIPAIRSLSDDRVVYLGTFSKTFAPGFRIGWVLAPHAVREKLVLAQESATLCPPTFSQFAITAYLAQHDWQGQIKVFAEMYRRAPRRDADRADERHARGRHLDRARRRLLRLAHAAPGAWTPRPCSPAR